MVGMGVEKTRIRFFSRNIVSWYGEDECKPKRSFYEKCKLGSSEEDEFLQAVSAGVARKV